MPSTGSETLGILVADAGNSRLKWGQCDNNRVTGAASLPLGDAAAWQAQWEQWGLTPRHRWTVAGVNPPIVEQLVEWLRARGAEVLRLDDHRQLHLAVLVEAPELVGIDRLLKAVAANARKPAGRCAIIVDCGSAVTVDWVDEAGGFRGGAIFPGFQLMTRALATFTAKLPQVTIGAPPPAMPGPSTTSAIHAGVYAAVTGGIRQLVSELEAQAKTAPVIYLSGGDAVLLASALTTAEYWPDMTLEGIRLTAARRP